MNLIRMIVKKKWLVGGTLLPATLFPSELISKDLVQPSDTLLEKVQLYFRFDRSTLEQAYMGNAVSLEKLERLLSPDRSDRTDSIKIEAYASPEGNVEYNRRLSNRRGAEVKKVLLWKFPHLESQRIDYRGMGENWDGLRQRVLADPNVPQRLSVLDVISRYPSPAQREVRLRELNKGLTYQYLLNNHFRYLRSGSSVFITLIPKMSTLRSRRDTVYIRDTVYLTQTMVDTVYQCPDPTYRYYRPLALKTNLLSDLLSVLNVELEFPIGNSVSLLSEWSFPWWGGVKYPGDYTIQLLSGSVEARYWFGQSRRMRERNRRWDGYNPLCGWFVGAYGGAGLYDMQLGGNGVQGEYNLSFGLTGGFAHPIGRYFHMEYSLGLGYFRTEYRSYTPMDDHKVWQGDARQTWLGPTKAKVSLVWIPQFKIKQPAK